MKHKTLEQPKLRTVRNCQFWACICN